MSRPSTSTPFSSVGLRIQHIRKNRGHFVKLTLKSRLFIDIGQVWAATLVANVLIYLFQMIAARGLGPQEYGLFGALMGIVYLAGGVSNAVGTSVAKLVSMSVAKSDKENTGPLITSAFLQLAALGIICLAVFLPIAPFIASYLQSDRLAPIMAVGIAIFFSLLMPVAIGALQGTQRFTPYSAVTLSHAGVRLALGFVVLAFGWGLLGMMGAVTGSILIATLVGIAIVRPPFRLSLKGLGRSTLAKAFIPILVGSMAVSFPTSIDVVLVRHFFPEADAGLYAGAAILGRIVLFVSLAISLVLFPKFVNDRINGNTGHALLYKGLGITALFSGGVALVFAMLPRLALRLLLGSEYVDASGLVPLYSAAMCSFALASVFLYYYLAVQPRIYLYALFVPHLLLELIFMYVFHQSTSQIILVMLAGNTSLFLTSFILLRFTNFGIRDGRSIMRGKSSIDVPEELLNIGGE